MKGVFNSDMASYLVTVLVILSIYSPIMVMAQSGNETRYRIAVPPKSGFTQFVKITWDPVTDQRNFSGFAIEVFNKAVAATVDKSILFDFIPFQTSDGVMNGSYDDMVEAVFNKQYDGAVGDITIRFSRTKWVDFTVAYTGIGISMLIPMHEQNTNVAKSLNSLTKEMVIGTFVLFFLSILVFVGSDIVSLVFGRNKDNTIQPIQPRSTISLDGADQSATTEHKAKKDAWKREMLGTVKGTRLMTLLWFVILLFLVTYYATSLISLLATEKSIAPNKSLNQIIRTGEKVGYYAGSLVFDLLKGYGISETQLFPYNSENQLRDMLSKGVNDGGITVAIDETLPLSVFLAPNCKNYTLIPINSMRSSGYGFAFPKGSNLVQEVSNGIIKLIDNGQLGMIQARTIGGLGTCDVDPAVDNVSDIMTPNINGTFKACAIASVVLLAIIYVVSIITSNRRCLRSLFP